MNYHEFADTESALKGEPYFDNMLDDPNDVWRIDTGYVEAHAWYVVGLILGYLLYLSLKRWLFS